MKKILPLAEPIIKCYPNYGHVFSIAGAYTNDYLPWVYNYFGQIFAPANFDNGNRLDYIPPELFDNFPWIELNHIERNVGLHMMGIVDLLRNYISHEFYFTAFFNVSKIAAYNSGLECHDCMLYGYDDGREEFYFADNFKNGKYAHGIASYAEIEQATKELHLKPDLYDFNCIRYSTRDYRRSYQFNKSMYIDYLRDYIEQRNTALRWAIPGITWNLFAGRKWGIGVYSFLEDYLDYAQEVQGDIDVRGFYVLKEYKQLLEKSVEYALGIGAGWKNVYLEVWDLLKKNIALASITLNLCIKYNISSDSTIFEKIRYYLKQLKENDQVLFPCLINILENHE